MLNKFVEILVNGVKRITNITSNDDVFISRGKNQTIIATNGGRAAGGDLNVGDNVAGDIICGDVVDGDIYINGIRINNRGRGSISVTRNNRSGTIIINGETIDVGDDKQIEVVINGDIRDFRLDAGNVRVNGNINGDARITSGNLEAVTINGSIKVTNGNVSMSRAK
ncbi:translocation/assembly module TamB domain-containing protein [Campylobacter sp. MOP7]|uniref:translocation/assembly module TamB domain-containing protein n=1 Tax=Campylobacter canis TaxID=3378588 RepID=UPI00387EBF99